MSKLQQRLRRSEVEEWFDFLWVIALQSAVACIVMCVAIILAMYTYRYVANSVCW
jgi:hypothetical protein